jgi:hypothetical protein
VPKVKRLWRAADAERYTMKRHSFVLLLLAGAWINANGDDCARDPTEAAMRQESEARGTIEARAVRDVLSGAANSVFFIDIFGGMMPVPNRFVPFAREPDSFNDRSADLILRGIDLLEQSGSIHVGLRRDLNLKLEGFDSILCKETMLYRHGLEVVIREFSTFSQVLIYDEEEYITITGSNPYLWEAMIDVWAGLKARRDQ